MDLPGFKKDEIKVQLKDGYLTLSAAKGLDKDEQDKKGNYIRRERYAGTLSRSFYVGDAVSEEDIHAKYEDSSPLWKAGCIRPAASGGRYKRERNSVAILCFLFVPLFLLPYHITSILYLCPGGTTRMPPPRDTLSRSSNGP